MLAMLILAPAALATHQPGHPDFSPPEGYHAAFPPGGEPCPFDLEIMPPGTICSAEDGGYWVPDTVAFGQYLPDTPAPTATVTSEGKGKGMLPLTGGPTFLGLAGAAMLVAGASSCQERRAGHLLASLEHFLGGAVRQHGRDRGGVPHGGQSQEGARRVHVSPPERLF
jgi:hypothetical protein